MFRTRLLSLLLALSLVLGLSCAVSAAQVDSGDVYCFSPVDFSQDPELMGICITSLPEGKSGAILLGSRILRQGDIVTADQVAQMTFSPVDTETDRQVQVGYLPIYPGHVAQESVMTIGIRGKEDAAPVAEDQALETYKNLPATGNLKVSDPEGKALRFTVTRQPRRGQLEVQEDGSFTYTPKKNKVGVDSFTYTAADPAGKVSREATVTITILKPTDDAQYTDTVGMDCRFAAEWMRNTGIFVGETVADNTCFSPQRTVTRGEFVTMLVKALELPTQPELTQTGYDDPIPQWLQPYLSAAVRWGATAGLPQQQTFGAQEPITGGEAAVMVQNLLDLSVPVSAQEASGGWAEAAIAALRQAGIQLSSDAPLTRGEAAQLLYQASCLDTEE